MWGWLRRTPREIDPSLWQQSCQRGPWLRGLGPARRERLRVLSARFLHEKTISPVAGLQLDEGDGVLLAALCCLPLLELGEVGLRGWSQLIVYPDAFRVQRSHVDAAGVLHEWDDELIGESWDSGPLILSWADIQADIAAELIRNGVEVWIANHRSVAGILDYIRRLGALVGEAARAERYADELQRGLDAIAEQAARLPQRPRVYVEEWDEPIITGIQWGAELVEIAGGIDVFPELSCEPLAKARILADGVPVIARNPDIIIGSWCGKKFRPEKVAARPGWAAINAVRDGELHEIKSPLILQPGPAALTDGVQAIAAIVQRWSMRQ